MPLPAHTCVLPSEGSPDAIQANSEWPKLACWNLPTDLTALGRFCKLGVGGGRDHRAAPPVPQPAGRAECQLKVVVAI